MSTINSTMSNLTTNLTVPNLTAENIQEHLRELALSGGRAEEIYQILAAAEIAAKTEEARNFGEALAGLIRENNWIKSISMMVFNEPQSDDQGGYYDSYSLRTNVVEVSASVPYVDKDGEAIDDEPEDHVDGQLSDDSFYDTVVNSSNIFKDLDYDMPGYAAALSLEEDQVTYIRNHIIGRNNSDCLEVFNMVAPSLHEKLIVDMMPQPVRSSPKNN